MCAAAPARAPSPVSLLSSSLASRVVPCVCPLTDEARGRPTLACGGGAEGDRRLTAGDGLHGSAPPSPSLSSRPPASSAAGHPARDATGPGASEKRAGKVREGDGSRALVAPRLISAGGPPSLTLATCIARVCTTRFLSDRCEPRETHRGPYLPTPEVVGRTMRARRGGGRVKKWGVVEKWCLARCQVAVAAPRRSRSPGPSTDTAGSREGSCACALKFSRHSDTNCVHTRRGHPRDPLDRLYFFGVHPPPRLPGSASKWARR